MIGFSRLARFAILVVVLAGLACSAFAQNNQNHPFYKKVSLNVENVEIRQALKSLFSSAGFNYTVAPDVRGTVTVSLTDVPFNAALEAVLRSASPTNALRALPAGRPNVVWEIVKVGPEEGDAPRKTQRRVDVHFNRAATIARELSQILTPASGVLLQPQTDNSIVIFGTDAQFREAKDAINMRDLKPRDIMLKAELVLVMTDPAGKKHRLVVSSTGFTNGTGPIHLKSNVTGAPAPRGFDLRSGQSDLQIRARLNADLSVEVDGEWSVDLAWSAPGRKSPFRIHNTYSTARAIREGDTVMVNGTILKLDSGSSEHAELLLFLTPSIPKDPANGGGGAVPAGFLKERRLP